MYICSSIRMIFCVYGIPRKFEHTKCNSTESTVSVGWEIFYELFFRAYLLSLRNSKSLTLRLNFFFYQDENDKNFESLVCHIHTSVTKILFLSFCLRALRTTDSVLQFTFETYASQETYFFQQAIDPKTLLTSHTFQLVWMKFHMTRPFLSTVNGSRQFQTIYPPKTCHADVSESIEFLDLRCFSQWVIS